MKIITINIISFICLLTSITAVAEQPRNHKILDKELSDRMTAALLTGNSSLLTAAERLEFSQIGLGFNGVNGAFRRPQQAKSSQLYSFTANGAIDLKGYYLKGNFKFGESFENDVRFNSIMDPYRGTPYIIADTSGGNWKKQLYKTDFSLASPWFGGKVSFGLKAGLDVGRGAKMIDPRPQSNSNEITLLPSFALRFGNHYMGGNLRYRRFMETVNLILYNSAESQKVYLLKGMGQYIYDIFSTTERERRYQGDGLGWQLQYRYTNGGFGVSCFAGYDNYSELTSDIESNRPRQRGRLYEDVYKAGMEISVISEAATHLLKAGYDKTARSGREIIQVFNSSSDVNAWVTDSEAPRRSEVSVSSVDVSYNFLFKDLETGKVVWDAAIEGDYTDYSDAYPVMKSNISYDSFEARLSVMRNVTLNVDNDLQLKLLGGIHRTWDTGMSLTEREPDDHVIAEGLVYPDATYLFSNYFSFGTRAAWEHIFRNGSSLLLSCSYGLVRSEHKLSRNTLSLGAVYGF
ncbi:MAG: DUF6850 family outer membrane beta-barrel protein [Bacteroidales bacterium]